MDGLPPSIEWNPTNKLFRQFRLKSEHERAKAAIPTPGSRRIRKLAGSQESVSRNAAVFTAVRPLDQKWSSRPLGCSTRRPRRRACSGLLRRCTPVPVPVAQLQSRPGLLNQLAEFLAGFEEGNSFRWHFDRSAGLWIPSSTTAPLSCVEGAESPNLHLVAGSQGTDDAVQYRADDDVGLLQ